MKILIIINDAPYGSEKAYNALRIANQLNKEHDSTAVGIFLIADGVNCAVSNQSTPEGHYNIERMLQLALMKGSEVKFCGSCIESRGLKNVPLIKGTVMSNMSELTEWVAGSDKVLTF